MKKSFFAAVAALLLGVLAMPAIAGAQPGVPNPPGPNAQPSHGSPTCVEADVVQTSPEAADLQAPNDFRHGDSHYLIIAGAPTCRNFCAASSILKCAPADTCPNHLNLLKVSGVKTCLEALAPPAEAAAGTGGGDATLPIAVPAASTSTGLAHTGAESAVLALLGTALIAFGAATMATHTRIKSD
jgi:hypothetical protein